LNSEAMTGCVAIKREPSALDMKPPVSVKIHCLRYLSIRGDYENSYR
jgi:hypothetical protein